MKNNFKAWFKAATIRAIRTAGETFASYVGCSAILSEVNWGVAISATILSIILTYAIAIQSLPEVE